MSYEVDVLAVGDESKSGDAIALRFGDFLNNPSDQTVVVIDGGYQDSGDKLVQRIKNEYNTSDVDLVISTHPDSDHINGLSNILEQLNVGELWMHTPWNISESIEKLANENRYLSSWGLSSTLKKSLEAAYDLEKLAIEKGIPIIEPFQGTTAFNKTLHVLGPSLDYYFELVGGEEENAVSISGSSVVEKFKNLISALWHEDELVEPTDNAVSSRNNSSVVILAQLGDNFLFVGDAGSPALHTVADYADGNNFDLATQIQFQQVPHHGSKRNVGPNILDRIVGPIVSEGIQTGKHAFISAAKKSTKHPSTRVTNAFRRRGATVSATCGTDNYFRSLDIPLRPGWGPVSMLDFQHSFEEE